MQIHHYIIASLWIIWCAVHSFLASETVNLWIQSKQGHYPNYFRLIYNILAGVLLMPILWYSRQFEPVIIFNFSGIWLVPRITLVGIAILFFWGGAREYDLAYFSGIRQLRPNSKVSIEPATLSTTGILQITRHPWYIGGIVFIWSYESQLSFSGIISDSILSLYLVIGAKLEEKKLVKKFGSQYTEYQDKVSMLVPCKWIKSKLTI